LQKEVEKLKSLVEKLTFSSNKLELILKSQRDSNNKARIGYNSLYSNRVSATKFIASKSYVLKFSTQKLFASRVSTFASFQKSRVIYYSCNGVGHKSFEYNLKKNSKSKVKKIWVPKGTASTNLQGSKKARVPKRTT